MTAPDWGSLRTLVTARSRDRCEACGVRLVHGRWSVHHRKPKGMGGTRDPELDSPANLLVTCGDGATGCHGWLDGNPEAYRRGLLIRRSSVERPEEVPVVLWSGRRVLLDDTGNYAPAPGPPYDLERDVPAAPGLR